MTPTPEEICKVVWDLCERIRVNGLLNCEGQDEDESIAAMVQRERDIYNAGRALIARLSPPSPEAAGNPNVPAGPAVAEGVKGETRRVWVVTAEGLPYVWDGELMWQYFNGWISSIMTTDDFRILTRDGVATEITITPEAAQVLADFDMREVSNV